MMENSKTKQAIHQTIIVIRHGERIDLVDYSWTDTAARPYDPPLTDKGVEQAREVGKEFVGKEIHCIVSSPFLRCLHTAQIISEVLNVPGLHTCNSIVDPFNGHCGMHEQPVIPAPDITQLGINIAVKDTTALPIYPEKSRDGVKRFSPAYSRLADEFWPHNIVIVTHGYGVDEAIKKGGGSNTFYVDYCNYVELTRSEKNRDHWTIAHEG